MNEQRQKVSAPSAVVPQAVPRLNDLVKTLIVSRQKIREIGDEPNDFPSFQLLMETAARLSGRGDSTFSAAEKAWQLIEDCVRVHRVRRKEHLRKQDERLLERIPQQIIYNDAVRIITEEGRIDRAAEKFQRFLKYYHFGGTRITSPEEYAAWHTKVSEYNLGQVRDLEAEFTQKPSERVEEYKADGMNNIYLRYLRNIYWSWEFQRFLSLANPFEKSRSGKLGGRGKKKRVR